MPTSVLLLIPTLFTKRFHCASCSVRAAGVVCCRPSVSYSTKTKQSGRDLSLRPPNLRLARWS
uniref:Secreted protein n=1 Tax=Mesocestoides corti TaxID=53468 RepID=A0A5K3EV39_MESCO